MSSSSSKEVPITVPQSLFDAVAAASSRPFALSYLFGARVGASHIVPRTLIAYERMSSNPDVVHALKVIGYQLTKPEPWGSTHGSKETLKDYT